MTKPQLHFQGMLVTARGTDSFIDFYRDRIRHAKGARLQSSELIEAHRAWAIERNVAPSSSKLIRSIMEANGHVHRKSDTIYYQSAVLGNFEGEPLPDRTWPVIDGAKAGLTLNHVLDDIDQLVDDLKALRRRIERFSNGLQL